MNHAVPTKSEISKLSRNLQIFSLVRIPLLGICFPRVRELTMYRSTVEIPLNWITKNHIRSMYFGALAMGAEMSTAIPLLFDMQERKTPLQFIFKDFNCKFLRRAEANVLFVCDDALAVYQTLEKAKFSGQREEVRVKGVAKTPSINDEIVMEYELTLSMKLKSSTPFKGSST